MKDEGWEKIKKQKLVFSENSTFLKSLTCSNFKQNTQEKLVSTLLCLIFYSYLFRYQFIDIWVFCITQISLKFKCRSQASMHLKQKIKKDYVMVDDKPILYYSLYEYIQVQVQGTFQPMNPNPNTYFFDDQICLQQQQFQHTLDADFFQILLATQKSYDSNPDETTLLQLVSYYTDCVNYFEIIQQSVSEYFQNKIKELMKNIKCFGSPEQKKKNRSKLENEVIKEMESASVQKAMKKQLEKQMNQKELEKESIRKQQLRLMRRLQKSKRSMHKSQSLSFSYGSIYSSPEPSTTKIKDRVANFEIEQLKTKNKYLFQKDINSSEDEQNTVG